MIAVMICLWCLINRDCLQQHFNQHLFWLLISYFYTQNCPETFEESETASASAPTPTPAGNAQKQEDKTKDETFKYTTTLSGDETPASIELLLNSGSIDAGGSNDENKVQLYQINATVRGGNKCADRLL